MVKLKGFGRPAVNIASIANFVNCNGRLRRPFRNLIDISASLMEKFPVGALGDLFPGVLKSRTGPGVAYKHSYHQT